MLFYKYIHEKYMKRVLKSLIKKTPIYQLIKSLIGAIYNKIILNQWIKDGRPIPPPHIVKQNVIKDFAKKYKIHIFVETGTYYGAMIESIKLHFDKIYSIELSKELYMKAKERFKDQNKIELIQGDSGIELEKIMDKIDGSTLFWLDGHYSGGVTARGDNDTPIYKELEHIFNAQDLAHVIIIDDARCFGTDPAYPSIEELIRFIKLRRPHCNITVEDDSIRIIPSKSRRLHNSEMKF